jgi:hypothetical protein
MKERDLSEKVLSLVYKVLSQPSIFTKIHSFVAIKFPIKNLNQLLYFEL